ncbi:MAG TPA: hypothetical protein PLY66_05230 [Acidobacteriota bacterium]|nr:hypothetical protein [Acidobacteriota bacterium]HQG93100.1 hypothetical protein [Acidobacteriota bacterium]
MSNSQQERTRRVELTVEQHRRLISWANTKAECEERARFQPYLAVQSERSRPSPIFVVAFTGVDTWKKQVLPEGFAALDLSAQLRLAGQVAREHYQAKNGSCGPFGKITGYALARTYDDWVGLDVDGEIVARSIPPVQFGTASLRLKGGEDFLRNGVLISSPGPEDDPNGMPPGVAPLPPGLHLVCAPPSAGERVPWSSILLRHHFGPDAVTSPAPGVSEDEFQQQVAQLVAQGRTVVAVGHGRTTDLALRQAERHHLAALLFVPSRLAESAPSDPEAPERDAQPTMVLHLIRPGEEEISGNQPGRSSAGCRQYTADHDPEKGLPGLLRDVEAFLACQ